MNNLLKTETSFILGIVLGMVFMVVTLFDLGLLENQKDVEIVSIERIVEPEVEQPYYEIILEE